VLLLVTGEEGAYLMYELGVIADESKSSKLLDFALSFALQKSIFGHKFLQIEAGEGARVFCRQRLVCHLKVVD